MVIETIPTEGSPDQAHVKKKKQGHKDSNPNSAHSCVGDNVLKVFFKLDLSNQFIFIYILNVCQPSITLLPGH